MYIVWICWLSLWSFSFFLLLLFALLEEEDILSTLTFKLSNFLQFDLISFQITLVFLLHEKSTPESLSVETFASNSHETMSRKTSERNIEKYFLDFNI